jgi:hypothetical protein
MSKRDTERMTTAARVIFYGSLFYVAVYAFYLIGEV